MLVLGKSLLTTGKCYNIDEKLQSIDATTQEDVEKFIVELFSKKYSWAYVGKDCDYIKNYKN